MKSAGIAAARRYEARGASVNATPKANVNAPQMSKNHSVLAALQHGDEDAEEQRRQRPVVEQSGRLSG